MLRDGLKKKHPTPTSPPVVGVTLAVANLPLSSPRNEGGGVDRNE